MRVGLMGCGTISGLYLENLQRLGGTEIVACADLVDERARAQAARFNVPHVYRPEELLADPEIEIVLNLTVPAAHAELSLAAVNAGKHVYTEKPLATSMHDGRRLLAAAAERGVRVGCAPDTFLGAGVQTIRDLIDSGSIGEPVAAAAHLLSPGHESWHPDPGFYYKRGGGPLLDMGPYYLTALVALLGPIARVSGMARASFPERVAANGQVIPVEVATHIVGCLEFDSGPLAHVVFSFDVQAARPCGIEVYGSAGSAHLTDPNHFGGPVSVARTRKAGWQEVPIKGPYGEESRGIGLVEMASAVRAGRPHQASGELGLHVLDVMTELLASTVGGGHRRDIVSRCERPDAVMK